MASGDNNSNNIPSSPKRGIFIVFEGLDRAGKSTQAELLANDIDAVLIKFPNYETRIGGIIKDYLQGKTTLDPITRHMLFSANRWETQSFIYNTLMSGRNIVCDRYTYSGVAYTIAEGYTYEWSTLHDNGLIAPDEVIYIDVNPRLAATRGEYGRDITERLDFQEKVYEVYNSLKNIGWKVISGNDEICSIYQKINVYINQGFKINKYSNDIKYLSYTWNIERVKYNEI